METTLLKQSSRQRAFEAQQLLRKSLKLRKDFLSGKYKPIKSDDRMEMIRRKRKKMMKSKK